jgi:WD40 repeat protein
MLLALTDANAAAGKRRALVIANTQYLNTSELKNPANDASLIESKLRSVGFEVQLEKNLSAKRFSEVLQKFASGLDKESEALFYYAGHGLQFQGANFLVGTDATLKSEADLQFETFRLNTIINVLEQRAGVTLIFWDACRDNPIAEDLLRTVTQTGGSTEERVRGGAAPVPPRRGDTYIVFSAEPDKKAVDGDGQFSPFAEALARHMAVPGLEIDDMLMKVTREVRQQTKDAQSPQRLSQLIRKFYFQKGASGDAQDAEVVKSIAAVPELLASEKRRIIFTPVAMSAPKNRINSIEPIPAAPKNIRLAQATVTSSDLTESQTPDIISIDAEPEAATVIRKLRISPNGKLLAVGDDEGLARIIRLSDLTVVRTIRAHTQRITDLDFTSDNRTLLTAGRDGALRLWQLNSGQKTREINIAGSMPSAAKLFQDECPEHSILMGDGKGRLVVWDLHRNRITTNKEIHQGPVNAVAFQPEGDGTFLSAGEDGVINVRVEDDGRQFAVHAHSGPILQAAYGPSGRSVYTAGNDGYVKIWEAAKLQQQRPKASLAGHFKSVLAADMSRDGRLLATGGGDKALDLWDAASGRLIGRMQGHAGDIVAIAFSPDGKFVFSAGEDKTVRIWSVTNREEVATLFFQKNGEKYAGVTSDKQTFGAQNSGLFSVFVDGRKISSAEAERVVPYLGPAISISEQP